MNIPTSWHIRNLSDVATKLKAGGTPSAKNTAYYGGDIPFVKIGDISDEGKYLDGTDDTLTNEGVKNSSAWVVPEGTLLYTMYGSYGIPKVTKIECATNQAIIALLPKKGSIDINYLYYYLSGIKDDLGEQTKGTTQQNLNAKIVRNIEIPLPPLNEQKRIVAKIEEMFSKLDSGVSELEEAEQRLGTYRHALLHKATTGELTARWRNDAPESTSTLDAIQGLREQLIDEKGTAKLRNPDIAEESDDLPSGWESATVEQICYSTRYGTSEKCGYDFDGVPVLRIPNIQNGTINLDNLKFSRSDADLSNIDPLEPGDFLIVRTNGSSNLIGRAAVVREEFDEPMYFASYLIRFRITPIDPLPRWVNFVWNSWPIREKILEVSATSAGQYNLSQSKVLQFTLPLPPLEEQEEILERVGRKMSVIDQLEQDLETELTRSKRLRQSILKHAFEGKLVPKEPTEEPPTPDGGNTKLESGKQATLSEVTSDVE